MDWLRLKMPPCRMKWRATLAVLLAAVIYLKK
jgi:hypothetical protein